MSISWQREGYTAFQIHRIRDAGGCIQHGVTWFDITDKNRGTRYFEIRGGGLKDDGKNKNDFLLHKLRA